MMTGAPTLADGTLYVATSSGEEVIGANPRTSAASSAAAYQPSTPRLGRFGGGAFTIPEEPKPVRKNSQGVQL